jgi:membrane fusion protein, multidrug efflux system
MSRLSTILAGSVLLLGLCVGLTGCTRARPEILVSSPTPVSVSFPIERDVTDYADFTGRTAAVDSVEVRARVWGYLEKVNFKEGMLVHKGDALFEIDPRTYEAELAQAEAKIAQAEARRKNLDADYQRTERLLAKNAATQADVDAITANRAEAEAAVKSATAARDFNRLNLEFTKVTAAISGRVGRALVTEGNLIQSGQNGGTLLTTIVSVDPMYAYFDVDEGTVLRVRQMIREGKAKSAREAELPAFLGLADERGFAQQGTLNFVDNQVNPKTGTLRVRGVFPNKDEVLAPGYFVRVRVPIGFAHKALLVNERAIDTDQGQKILYVVDEKNEVTVRPIRVGAPHDGLRAIEDGVKPDERVIVIGLQQVRPGATVDPKLVDMPGSQRSEVRDQRSEVRSQKSEITGVIRTR